MKTKFKIGDIVILPVKNSPEMFVYNVIGNVVAVKFFDSWKRQYIATYNSNDLKLLKSVNN